MSHRALPSRGPMSRHASSNATTLRASFAPAFRGVTGTSTPQRPHVLARKFQLVAHLRVSSSSSLLLVVVAVVQVWLQGNRRDDCEWNNLRWSKIHECVNNSKIRVKTKHQERNVTRSHCNTTEQLRVGAREGETQNLPQGAIPTALSQG